MQAFPKQRAIESAVRAACKAGLTPTSAQCHPDGRIVLCFDERKVTADDALDAELEKWKRTSVTS
jgi:hypothetical protein